jgi:uncharacterized protein (DUF362 family)
MRSTSDLSRRRFLQGLVAGITLSACRRQPYDSAGFRVPQRSGVALLPASSYDDNLSDLITRGLQMFKPRVLGRRVLLKPNLVEVERGAAINTHPRVVGAAAEAFLRAGASEVIVAEGPGHRRDAEHVLVGSGLYAYLEDMGIRFVDLNHDDVRPVPLRSRFMGLSPLWLPVTALQADVVVSVAKLKTHHWAGMTASMKNLFGLVPGAVYGWPKNLLHVHGIENAILDLNATIRPDLAIVDAIVGMEGDGPIMGRARNLGFLAMGTDPVAVDATCARIIGLDPTRITYLNAASQFLGNVTDSRIDQWGERVARYQTTFEVVDAFKSIRLAS